jgi:hypothetical protein
LLGEPLKELKSKIGDIDEAVQKSLIIVAHLGKFIRSTCHKKKQEAQRVYDSQIPRKLGRVRLINMICRNISNYYQMRRGRKHWKSSS